MRILNNWSLDTRVEHAPNEEPVKWSLPEKGLAIAATAVTLGVLMVAAANGLVSPS